MVLRAVLVASLTLQACSHPAPPAAARADERPVTPPATAEESPSTNAPPPASPPAQPGSPAAIVVVARVVDSGPIGSGRCAQCSHQVLVEESNSPAIPAGSAPLWVHFETCADRPAPATAPGAIEPCSLRRGTSYRLTLQPGGSPNFGDAPMIVDARPR